MKKQKILGFITFTSSIIGIPIQFIISKFFGFEGFLLSTTFSAMVSNIASRIILERFPYKRTLNKFDQNQIKYCVFKSSDHLCTGLKGETDVDILIEEEKINFALIQLNELGFKTTKPSFSVINPYRFGLIGFCQKSSKLYLDIMTRFVVGINRAKTGKKPRNSKNIFKSCEA